MKYTVDYDLYVDTALKKTYRYEIKEKSMIWIGAIPFFWVNFLTNHHANAFTATIHQFIRDARDEGLLRSGLDTTLSRQKVIRFSPAGKIIDYEPYGMNSQ